MSMQLQNGRRYTADIELGALESLAGNSTVQRKLEDAGFTNVLVTGDGRQRAAMGTWGGSTRAVDLPSQVRNVRLCP